GAGRGGPAPAPRPRLSGPSRPTPPARPSPPAGMPPPGTTPPTWQTTEPAPPGTPTRPSRRPPTWPPSSAASSSLPDLRHLALTSQHPKKSTSSVWPGRTQRHNHESRGYLGLEVCALRRRTSEEPIGGGLHIAFERLARSRLVSEVDDLLDGLVTFCGLRPKS